MHGPNVGLRLRPIRTYGAHEKFIETSIDNSISPHVRSMQFPARHSHRLAANWEPRPRAAYRVISGYGYGSGPGQVGLAQRSPT